jgi:cell division septal protein FtsQ
MAREVLQQKKRKAAPMSQEEREARQSKMRWIFLALVIMFLLAVYLVFELVIVNRGT